MKKLLAIILSLCMLFGIIPFGVLSASADVGDYEMSEIESNNTMSLADRIYNDYTVSGVVSGSDMDYFKFTLSSTSSVRIITIADYKSCFLAGIFNSSENAVAVSEFAKYSESGYPTYLTSVTLNAGTYYYVVFNKDASTLRNDYMFYFSYTTSTTSHTHYYSNSCDTMCNGCTYTRTVTHSYSADCDTVCNICSTTRSSTTAHEYTNACDGDCDLCGVSRSVSHSYDNACDASCNICTATRTAPHNYGAGIVTKVATCKKEGVRTYTCSTCNATKTAVVEKSKTHSYKTTTTKATTSKNGSIVKKCTICNNTTSSTIKYAKTFKLSTTSYTYNGKVKTPSVVVKDSAGKTLKKSTDYTVSYAKGRKYVGTYKVTIKMKGNYSGTKTLTFKIVPRAASVNKLTAKKKALSVKLNRSLKQSTGYEIQYSTSKKFTKSTTKTKKVSSYKTTSVTLKSLKAKKTYYVRVRTYKSVNGQKYYSNWSSYKSKKTK